MGNWIEKKRDWLRQFRKVWSIICNRRRPYPGKHKKIIAMVLIVIAAVLILLNTKPLATSGKLVLVWIFSLSLVVLAGYLWQRRKRLVFLRWALFGITLLLTNTITQMPNATSPGVFHIPAILILWLLSIFLVFFATYLWERGEKKALVPGGYLSIETINIDGYDRRFFKDGCWGGYFFPRHMNLFNFTSLKRLMKNHELIVEKQFSLLAPINWVFSCHA